MPYSLSTIAEELRQTAEGAKYYGNAIYVARDFPFLSDEDRLELHRWLVEDPSRSQEALLRISGIVRDQDREIL